MPTLSTGAPVGARKDLTDRQWHVLEPLLPTRVGAWRRKWTHRQLINGIRWRLRVGAPWRDVPEPADHGLGKSRGGWTTKIHLACEQGRGPLAVVLTPDTAGTARSSPRSWTGSGWPAWARDAHGPARSDIWLRRLARTTP